MAKLPHVKTTLGFTLSIVASRCWRHIFMSAGNISASLTVGHFTEAAQTKGIEIDSLIAPYSGGEKGFVSPCLYFKESERNNTSEVPNCS